LIWQIILYDYNIVGKQLGIDPNKEPEADFGKIRSRLLDVVELWLSKMNLKWKLKISQIATVQDVLNYIENGRIYFNIRSILDCFH
jgi:hypothetical protein